MSHDAILTQPMQDDRRLAAHLRARLVAFVRPVLTQLAQQIDIRLVQTALDVVQVIITHRHRARGLLLSELGGYLLGPAQAPAGTKGISLPHKGPPLLVPGLHWDGIVVLGMDGPPTLAHLQWWTTREPHASSQREVEQRLLSRCATDWGQSVCHVWNRGYAGSPWVQAAITANVRFIVRWKKGNKLLDNWGEARKAWQIARGKRSVSYRWLRDPRTKQQIKVGVVAVPVTLLDHPQPLWLVVARLGAGREPWYLLTNQPIRTIADAWAVVLAYARRWQIEEVWRASKSELAFESPRVEEWEVRLKLLLLASLAYAFLLHLLDPSFDELRGYLLRNWCHRSGRRYRTVAAPLYRLRSALSRLWQAAAPPGYHHPLLNSG